MMGYLISKGKVKEVVDAAASPPAGKAPNEIGEPVVQPAPTQDLGREPQDQWYEVLEPLFPEFVVGASACVGCNEHLPGLFRFGSGSDCTCTSSAAEMR